LTTVVASFVFGCFSLTSASATIVKVEFESTLDIIGQDAIFGVNPGSSGTLLVSFDLDTDGATIHTAGTSTSLGNLSSDFYGFSIASISNLSANFGSKSWDIGDVTSISYRRGLTADVFFDTAPVVGATTNLHMYLADGLHEAYLGGATATASGLELKSEGQVFGDPWYSYAFGAPAQVTISDILPTDGSPGPGLLSATVPVPAGLPLFVTALAGLGFARYRKRRVLNI
jgi:hypothetical protein